MKVITSCFALGVVLVAFVYTRASGQDAGSVVAPSGRYTINGSTVYDPRTHLTWAQAGVYSATYANAKADCASASLSAALGGSGWRVPTIKELLTIFDYSQATSLAIDPSFLNASTDCCWSSTLDAHSPSNAWTVAFVPGAAPATLAVTSVCDLRCVR